MDRCILHITVESALVTGEPAYVTTRNQIPHGQGSYRAPRPMHKDEFTTVMLRNLPNKYSAAMLMDIVHRAGFIGDVDFAYVPYDDAVGGYMGYAFLNFRSSVARRRFALSFDGAPAQRVLLGSRTRKILAVTKAKWQGRDVNFRRLQGSRDWKALLVKNPSALPLILDEAGRKQQFCCKGGRCELLKAGVAPVHSKPAADLQPMYVAYPVGPIKGDVDYTSAIWQKALPSSAGRGGAFL